MSMGRPVITTNVAGCKETVLHEINGLLIPAMDKVSLVSAIQKMLKMDDRKIIEMGQESIKLVREKYDVRKVNQHIINIINN
jgi:glycosyltransferase involved in cell wall biosynthesis